MLPHTAEEKHQSGFLKFLLAFAVATVMGSNVIHIHSIQPDIFTFDSKDYVSVFMMTTWLISLLSTYVFYRLSWFAKLSNSWIAGLLIIVIMLLFVIIVIVYPFYDEEYAQEREREREERELEERELEERELEAREYEEALKNVPSIIRDWEPDWAKGQSERVIEFTCFAYIEDSDRGMLDILITEDRDYSWCIEYMDGKRPPK